METKVENLYFPTVNATEVARLFEQLEDFVDFEYRIEKLVHKLLYYAQVFTLKKYNQPLFNERIEAWEEGPVIPSVYENWQEKVIDNLLPIDEKVMARIPYRIIRITDDILKGWKEDLKSDLWPNIYSSDRRNLISQESLKSSPLTAREHHFYKLFSDRIDKKEQEEKEATEQFPDWDATTLKVASEEIKN